MTAGINRVRIETIRERGGAPYAARARVTVDGHDISSLVTAIDYHIDNQGASTVKLTLVDADVDLDAVLDKSEN